ncbi:Piso0_005203 [Millerozyma farinosa CBS 7064]|uniref:Piso0_005203 protein n=1 Tax=Pichia sorbitophila (strain ATCC MYA-4447 / BCRC 22081 / CBS 7064 / NBRC 10061 / NRRL Y-12695) TaxID=559304 RepID=G8Y1J5_PICSO|nr:Piso0_005203 [Millerozyma farinosa CBS 7064]
MEDQEHSVWKSSSTKGQSSGSSRHTDAINNDEATRELKDNYESEYTEYDDNNVIDRETILQIVSEFKQKDLCEVIRPRSLEDVVGQRHLLDPRDGLLASFIQMGYLPSIVFHGPPGIGKTSIARTLVQKVGYGFIELSATDTKVETLEKIVSDIKTNLRLKRDFTVSKVVIFIDEIHRFSKTQQDFLLPYIESGLFTFIGATTLNPRSRIRCAILSRCQVLELKPLDGSEIRLVLKKAAVYENIRRKFIDEKVELVYGPKAFDLFHRASNGDTRIAIRLIELVSGNYKGEAYSLRDATQYHEIEIRDLEKDIRTAQIKKDGLSDPDNIPLFVSLYDAMRNVYRSPEGVTISPVFNVKPKRVFAQDLISAFVKTPSGPLSNSEPSDSVSNERGNLSSGQYSKHDDKLTVHFSYGKSKQEQQKSRHSTDSRQSRKRRKVAQYIAHVEFSDDSDVEPGDVYSDDEDQDASSVNERLDISTFEAYFTTLSEYLVVTLMSKGESPLYIFKHLVLFACLYLNTSKSALCDLMGQLKSLKNSNAVPLKVLSNTVEYLARKPKFNIHSALDDPVERLATIKNYIRSESAYKISHNLESPVISLRGLDISYHQERIEQLLTPEPQTEHSVQPLFEICPISPDDH